VIQITDTDHRIRHRGGRDEEIGGFTMFKTKRTNTYHEYLRGVPLFAGLSESELATVSQATSDLRFEAGRTLVREGTVAHEMMILTSGTASVTRGDDHLADIGAGEVLGELAVLSNEHRMATVTATSDVEVIHITADRFSQLLRDVPGIATKMLPVVAVRAAANREDHSVAAVS
jgi:CRP/FNR family cyclic AMP-dependent transcriptional regulator